MGRARDWTVAIAAMLIVIFCGSAFWSGCEKRNSSPELNKPMPAATEPSRIGDPTTAASQPVATLIIDGNPTVFPGAKLVLTKKSDGMEAILCSDDPASAIESAYHGNSFMFDMKLDIEDRADLPEAVWEFKTKEKGPQDSMDGIFLNGARHQMQPENVRVTFEKEGDKMVALLKGDFVSFETRDVASPAQSVRVEGRLEAGVQERE